MHKYPLLPEHPPSMVVVAVALVGCLATLHKLNWFPGTRSLFAGVPALAAWYAVLLPALLSLRLPYSVTYLIVGSTISLFFIFLQTLWQYTHPKEIYYVPIGRTDSLEKIQGVLWRRLDKAELPINSNSKIPDAIVADLHAPALHDDWQRFLAECALHHIPVYNIRQIEEALTGRIKIHHMYENTLGSLMPNPIYMFIKYSIEVVLILISLPVTLPIMLFTAIAIKLEDGGSIFYTQERVGYRGKSFKIYKFRSMSDDKNLNNETETAIDDSRITRTGKFIRKTRLDELPQFLNVILGDMSLIGPRAEYKKFADLLEKEVPFYKYRSIVRPGITGWAQVMHGYATGADETSIKIEHDFYYIKHFSLWLDVLIIFMTFKIIITGFGAR